MKKTLHIKVYGRVQGVFFRIEAKKKAMEMGVLGSVKNLPDGSVEIFANGEEKNLNKLLEWCYNGPKEAKVDNIEYEFLFDLKTFDKFEIL